MAKFHISIAACLFALSGCEDAPLNWMYVPNDPETRQYAFQQCLKATKGPDATQYNDWDEAIEACQNHAASVSRYCPKGALCVSDVNVTLEQVRQILPKEPAK